MAAAVAQHAAERKLFVAGGHAAANGLNKLVISVYVPRRSSLFMHKAHAAPRCTAKSKRTGKPCRCNAPICAQAFRVTLAITSAPRWRGVSGTHNIASMAAFGRYASFPLDRHLFALNSPDRVR
jgi:hypothetical protein